MYKSQRNGTLQYASRDSRVILESKAQAGKGGKSAAPRRRPWWVLAKKTNMFRHVMVLERAAWARDNASDKLSQPTGPEPIWDEDWTLLQKPGRMQFSRDSREDYLCV